MSKLTKNKKLALEKIEDGRVYTIEEAAQLVKEITFTKFDASVDIDVRLGVDPRKANQMVRGVVTLPHGTGKAVKEVKQGKIDFKVDKFGIVHTSIGKVNFEAEKIMDNAREFMATIQKLKPSSAKGTYVKSVFLSSTMSPGIKLDLKSLLD